MTLRTPAQPDPEVKPLGWDNPVYECESCGKQAQSHKMVDIYIQVLSPFISAPIVCIQHWACSIECFQKVHAACLNEHIIPQLRQIAPPLER